MSYEDGSEEVFGTDDRWTVRRSQISFTSIYDGEEVDCTLPPLPEERCVEIDPPAAVLTARLSPPVTVHERMTPREIFRTPAGELVLDMGQNHAGIFEWPVELPRGAQVHLSFGEVLQNGCFYRDNLRSARADYRFTAGGGPVSPSTATVMSKSKGRMSRRLKPSPRWRCILRRRKPAFCAPVTLCSIS